MSEQLLVLAVVSPQLSESLSSGSPLGRRMPLGAWLAAVLSPSSQNPRKGHVLRALPSLMIPAAIQLHGLAGCYTSSDIFVV